MIAGVALVVDDISKGQRLAFKYPLEPRVSGNLADFDFHRMDDDNLAKLFRPKSALCGHLLSLVIGRVGFVSFPTEVFDDLDEMLPGKKEGREIVFFNVVYATALEEESGIATDDGTDKGIESLAAHMATAMLHEERRCRYVSREVKTIMSIRERAGSSKDILEQVLMSSSLARFLRELYCTLDAGNVGIHQSLNDWVSLSFGGQDNEVASWRSLKPFETLLLLEDEEKVLADLPQDCSPQLRRVVLAVNPLNSFEELSLAVEMPLDHLYRIVTHLVYWRKARIIDTIVTSNIYQVHPSADLSASKPCHADFRQKFPHRSLAQILALFESGKSLQEIMASVGKSQHLTLLHMLVWLMQHEMLQQVRQYVSILLPSDQNIESLHDGSRQYALLVRLWPYFQGGHRLREAVWAERLDAVEVAEVLQAYSSILSISLRPA